jgi:hypothetical protein
MGILKEEEWKWADEDNKADDVDVTLHLYPTSTPLPSKYPSSSIFNLKYFKIIKMVKAGK